MAYEPQLPLAWANKERWSPLREANIPVMDVYTAEERTFKPSPIKPPSHLQPSIECVSIWQTESIWNICQFMFMKHPPHNECFWAYVSKWHANWIAYQLAARIKSGSTFDAAQMQTIRDCYCAIVHILRQPPPGRYVSTKWLYTRHPVETMNLYIIFLFLREHFKDICQAGFGNVP